MLYSHPPLLQKGQKVAVIATAGTTNPESLSKGIELLNSWGLHVVEGTHLYDKEGYFAGTDKARKKDLQKALDDDSIKAIFCARGGYGTTRILDAIRFDTFRKLPKWIIGFSDVTALHAQAHQIGIQSIHAPTVSALGKSEADQKLYELLFLT